MNLSNSTLSVLRNFATINPNLYVSEYTDKLKTISEAKNIMAVADLDQSLPGPWGIYDLNEFLSAINLLQNPDIGFDSQRISMLDENKKKQLTYFCAASEILTYPQKDIQNPEYEVSVEIKQEVLTGIKKAASVFGFDTFQIVKENDSEKVLCRVCDLQNRSTNIYAEQVGEIDNESSFNFDFLIANMKCMQFNYDVHLSSKCISCWEANDSNDIDISYWIAMEKTSSYSNS